MRFFIKALLVLLILGGLLLLGWFVTWLASLFDFGGYPFGFVFLSVFGVEWISPSKHDRIHKGNCSCSACRKKHFEKAEKRKAERLAMVLESVPLFCKVFPEGIIGSCGFCWNGYCEVFEDSCVRWNELGDKKDYGAGKPNPFKPEGGE